MEQGGKKPRTRSYDRAIARCDWTGARLSRLRQELQLSQREMADLIGVHRVTVTRWEKGDVIRPGPVHRVLTMLATHPEVFLKEQR